MARSKNTNKVEAVQAVSALEPCCGNCKFSTVYGDSGLLCGIKLPSFLKRSDRPHDWFVGKLFVCDLHSPHALLRITE